MAANPQAFYCLWRSESVRERLFELLDNKDICAVRLANSACCNLVTKRLFLRTHLTFTANSFTRASRIEALSRIGHHIEHLTFYFPHSPATFLPPLIHPSTGEEILFIYNPHTSTDSVTAKYGSSELGEILTQQYPPVFHAATHVSSFIGALGQMPNMRHLTIKTPGQDPRERYRRDVVDYALISLRIALERAPLAKLSKLTLSSVHPCAFNYLRHAPGFGTTPAAALRWRQIRKLYIAVDSWDFYNPCSPGLDHLKIMDDFIRSFAPQLVKFSFAWLGTQRGPCPIALAGDPLFAPPRSTKKLFNEVTGPMSPLPAKPFRRPLVMPRLRYMAVRNATMNADQLRGLVESHKATVREFDFENVALLRGGSWEDALAPLTEGEGAEAWTRRSLAGPRGARSPPVLLRTQTSGTSFSSAVASSVEDECLPPSSAAAAAASRELLEVDLGEMVLGGVNDDVGAFEKGVEEWARGVTAAAARQHEMARPSDLSRPGSAGGRSADGEGLGPEVETARQASPGLNAQLKKRRVRRKSDDALGGEDKVKSSGARGEGRPSEESRRHSSRSRHKHSRSDATDERPSSSGSRRHRRRHHHHRRHRSEELPESDDFMPGVIGTDDESYQPPRTPPRQQPRQQQGQPPEEEADMSISVPILNPEPLPIMLQPTVYDPSARFGPLLRSPESASPSPSPARSYTYSTPSDDDGLSPTQRSIEADLLAEAEEAAARSSALQRAKEAVITKLSREFAKRSRAGKEGRGGSKESAAVIAGISALNLSMNLPTSHQHHQHHHHHHHSGLSCGSSSSVAYRFKEGIFGRSLASVAIEPDQRSLESQTALVPLILSRS
ncbi:hypothetical protein VTJ83DRAFT_7400 [Remersonia thermophila]|uniref:Uncharacterized protein n=1 Tax=Remersonia thermophila TaxID=72144 RepID=A0ABR4D3J0_9PEZI